MGKASRTKRERREGGDREATIAASVGRGGGGTRQLPVFWIVVALLVVAGIAAIVLTAPDDSDRARNAKAATVPSFADVSVTGANLASWDGTGTDSAIGDKVPTIAGTDFDGMRRNWMSGDGTARVYVVVAHWCPHCRDEVPRIVDWTRSNDVPEGVEIVTVSTAVDEGQPNFPPAAWLDEERWPFRVLIDDEVGSAAEALGVEGYPYLVFTDGRGTVQSRFSGEMPIAEFDAAVRDLVATPAAAAA